MIFERQVPKPQNSFINGQWMDGYMWTRIPNSPTGIKTVKRWEYCRRLRPLWDMQYYEAPKKAYRRQKESLTYIGGSHLRIDEVTPVPGPQDLWVYKGAKDYKTSISATTRTSPLQTGPLERHPSKEAGTGLVGQIE